MFGTPDLLYPYATGLLYIIATVKAGRHCFLSAYFVYLTQPRTYPSFASSCHGNLELFILFCDVAWHASPTVPSNNAILAGAFQCFSGLYKQHYNNLICTTVRYVLVVITRTWCVLIGRLKTIASEPQGKVLVSGARIQDVVHEFRPNGRQCLHNQ